MPGAKAQKLKFCPSPNVLLPRPRPLLDMACVTHCLMIWIQVLGPTVLGHHHVPLCGATGTPNSKFARVEDDPVQVFSNHQMEEMRKCEVLLALLNLDHVICIVHFTLQSNFQCIKGYWLSIIENPMTVYPSMSTLKHAPSSQPPPIKRQPRVMPKTPR